MREYKFRGKRLDNGEWVEGSYCYNPLMKKGEIYSFDDKRCYVYRVDPDTVGQYTGPHDKNGKEVYEGDIVGFDDRTSTEGGYYELFCMGAVEWCSETASFEVSDRLYAESYEVLDECVVIGNIHDNPDLLQK